MNFDPGRAIFVMALAAGATAAPALAQRPYPVKPIRLIVPLAPGGPSDILARTLAQKLTENLKQTVFVDNRPGASAVIGTEIAAKSPPDGYTIILVSNTIAINPSLFSKLPYDTLKDLAPISLLATTPYILAVHPSLPAKTVKELIALAKARPGELNHASGGAGTGPHLAMEVFRMRTGIKLVHITYKGGGPAMNDFIAGHTQVYMANMITAFPQVKSGRIRALAMSSEKRAEVAPEIPTIAESGVPGFNEGGQHGIVAPAGVAREIVSRLHGEIVRAMQAPEIRSRLQAEGSQVVAGTPDEYGALIRSEIEKWAKVIKSAGIRVE